jgi:predicted ferric reductase
LAIFIWKHQLIINLFLISRGFFSQIQRGGMMIQRLTVYCIIGVFIAVILVQLNSYLALVTIPIPSTDTDKAAPPPQQRDYSVLITYIVILLLGSFALLVQSWFQQLQYKREKLLGQPPFRPTSWLYRQLRYEHRLFSIVTWSLLDIIKIALVITLNIALLLIFNSRYTDPLQQLSNRSAQLAITNVAFSVLLSAKLSTIQQYFFSVQDTLRWHAWFGRIAFIQVAYHASYQLQYNYARQDNSLFSTLTTNVRYVTGTLMLIALCLLTLGSHPLIRLASYRIFRITHLTALAVLIVFGCLHHWSFYVFYVVVLLFWVVDQLERSYQTETCILEALPGDVVKVQCQTPYLAHGFAPGQFAFLAFESRSWLKTTVYAHPFSISRVDEEEEASRFTFYIKATGTRTKWLYDSTKMLQVSISKPLGRPGIEFGDFERVVLVAEGMGITPWISVLQYIEQKHHAIKTKSIDLIWSIHSIGRIGVIL